MGGSCAMFLQASLVGSFDVRLPTARLRFGVAAQGFGDYKLNIYDG